MFSLQVSASQLAGLRNPWEAVLRQEYLQFTIPLFSASSEALTISLFSKDFYNYILSWILSGTSLSFGIVFLLSFSGMKWKTI